MGTAKQGRSEIVCEGLAKQGSDRDLLSDRTWSQLPEHLDRNRFSCASLVIFYVEIFMLSHRAIPCLVMVGFLLLGVTGCGGAPPTGESLKQAPDTEARGKQMAEGYMKKAAAQNAKNKGR
jgi:hypothetical protein